MCPPFNDDEHEDEDDDGVGEDDDHPICTQFIERSLYGGQQGGGVKVMQENLQRYLQLVPARRCHHHEHHSDLDDHDRQCDID